MLQGEAAMAAQQAAAARSEAELAAERIRAKAVEETQAKAVSMSRHYECLHLNESSMWARLQRIRLGWLCTWPYAPNFHFWQSPQARLQQFLCTSHCSQAVVWQFSQSFASLPVFSSSPSGRLWSCLSCGSNCLSSRQQRERQRGSWLHQRGTMRSCRHEWRCYNRIW